jgi:hypothetical protein
VAGAQTTTLCVTLDGGQLVPPVVTAGSGSGTLSFDPVTKMLTLSVTYMNLSGAATVAHIHGPALAGQNAGVVFALTPPSPFVDVVGPLSAAQETDLFNGLYYINVHTAEFGPGEIRGQITSCPVPVEDRTWGAVKSMYP